jgi:hypothetical protein
MEYTCPFCHCDLIQENRVGLIQSDYICRASIEDHFFGQRMTDEQLSVIKLRIGRYCLKVDYQQKTALIWDNDRYVLEQPKTIPLSCLPVLDFSDPLKLKQKIETYVLFS